MSKIVLTPKELEIMELLWKVDRSLSRSEIIELSPNRSWQSSSIHILLNKLLEKNIIAIDGFVKTGKNYGRTYRPTITHEQFLIQQIHTTAKDKSAKKKASLALFSALLKKGDITQDIIDELQSMLDAQKSNRATFSGAFQYLSCTVSDYNVRFPYDFQLRLSLCNNHTFSYCLSGSYGYCKLNAVINSPIFPACKSNAIILPCMAGGFYYFNHTNHTPALCRSALPE